MDKPYFFVHLNEIAMEHNDGLSTKEDVEKFVRWLGDPKFRQLFETFVKTASDAEEKSKFEADSRRIRKQDDIVRLNFAGSEANQTLDEKQIPLKVDPTTQQVFIRPDRGFCLVTRTRIYKDYKFNHEQPLIVNICHHKAIESAQLIHRHTNCGHDHAHVPDDHKHDDSDDVYKVPYSLGPAIKMPYRDEIAKVYDCVFSSKTFQEFKNDDKKQAVLIETALKAVKEQYAENPLKEYSILPDIAYFEEPKRTTMKQEIIRSPLPVVAQSETFKKTPIIRCQTPLMALEDRTTILKSISDHIKGDNQFHVTISAHNDVPATVIQQLDNVIQIRVDSSSNAQPLVQWFTKYLEVTIANDFGQHKLVLELNREVNESSSFSTVRKECVVIIITKRQTELWGRILNCK